VSITYTVLFLSRTPEKENDGREKESQKVPSLMLPSNKDAGR